MGIAPCVQMVYYKKLGRRVQMGKVTNGY
uniref:Uncharacterized protein n=1 Tax=Arundo donax TaxID=35708 RepID=A0A0A9BJG3_ARUDO